VVEALSALPQAAEPGVRRVRPEQWHVTLRFLGDADPTQVTARLRSIDLPAATATLGPAVARLGLEVVVVPVSGLDALAAIVAASTADLGVPPDPRPFTGHVTLARLRRRAACRLIGSSVEAAFEVDELCLVDSRSGADGLQYEVLARFPTTRSA
jgi:2'-5' RNA ligase